MKKIVWDRLGIAFSSACVLHCLLVAFLPLVFPMLSEMFHSTWVHIIGASLILVTTPLAFVPGYRKHGITWILVVAVFGVLFILSGVVLEEKVSDVLSHSISIFGSALLLIGHAKNIQHSHRHKHQCC